MPGSIDDFGGFSLDLPHDLGRYRLDAEIGRGGMGIVYHAEDTMLERPVAVKVLLPQLAADSGFVARFKREAQMAARLEHPCIVTVHDVGQLEGLVFFVMRLVTGKPMDRLIEEGLPWSRAENIAIQIADAMAYAHENKVIHRDIKPENVIVSKDGQITITDFGLARPEQQAGGPTQAGIILGTPGYMPPEQALGKQVDQRADIYSYGVMLFELITGDLPFDGETAFSIINQHISTPAPAVTSLKPNTPKWLSDLVAKLLEKEPAARPQSMAEVAEMLRNQQGSVIEVAETAADEVDNTAQGVVARIRGGELALADALMKYPEVSATLQEVFRKEMTVVSFDLAGSTALKQTGGGTVAIGPLFSAYRELVDKTLTAHGSTDSVWAGDGTVAVFTSPSEAAQAAQDIVRGLREINVRFPDVPDMGVRVGVHTGAVLRDPNLPLGQVTSRVFDITGHIQKDAKPGLVEISQATMDKLPSQEGWIRIRNAREGNLTIFAWHPDGPDQVPQSWVQRMRQQWEGGGAEAGAAPGAVATPAAPATAAKDKAKEKGAKTRTASIPAAALERQQQQKKAATTKPLDQKFSCPYCEADVTVLDQKCPSCDRLNRYYDPAAEKGKKKKQQAAQPRRANEAARARRVTLVQKDPRRTSAVGGFAGGPRSTAQIRAQQKQRTKQDVDAVTELIVGVLIGSFVIVGLAYFLMNNTALWWVDRGQPQQGTSFLALAILLVADVVVGYLIREGAPGVGAGIMFGIPVGLGALYYLGWLKY